MRRVSILLFTTWLIGCTAGGDGKDADGATDFPTDAGPTTPPTGSSAPVVADDLAQVAEGASIVVDVLANDSDPDGDLDPTTVEIATLPGLGTAQVEADGRIRYEHDGSDTVADELTYTVRDATGLQSAPGSLAITVEPVNDAPVAVDDQATVDEGASVTLDLLANDLDDEGLAVASTTLDTLPAYGTLTDHGDGTVTYDHDGSETTSDSFSYAVRDLDGEWSNTALATITVTPVNDLPVAVDDVAVPPLPAATIIDVAANDFDAEGLDLGSIVVVAPPVSGTAVPQPDGTVSYTPGASPVDGFTYTISDMDGAVSNVASVTITMPQDAPCGAVVLDPSFGGGDGTVNPLTPGTDYDDNAYAIAEQDDGMLVVGGSDYRDTIGRTSSIVRLDSSGDLDLTFGGGDGFAEDLFVVESSVYGLALEPDGQIVAGGTIDGDMGVFRLETDGAFDPAFGTGGVVQVAGVDVSYDARSMLALQDDGAIIAVGYDSSDFVVVRLLSDGTLDPAFGVGGIATLDLGGSDIAYTLLLQPDGAIVVGGTTDGDFGVARLLSDGSPDPGFGVGGVATVDVSGADDRVWGLGRDPVDGAVIAVGPGDFSYDYLYDAGWALARFTSAGTLDAAFGVGGTVYDTVPVITGGTGLNDRPYAVEVLLSGELLVGGRAGWNDSFGRMLIARYLPDGTLDACFDSDGYYLQQTWDVFSQSDAAGEILLHPDNSFTVAGTVNPSAFGYKAVFRTSP